MHGTHPFHEDQLVLYLLSLNQPKRSKYSQNPTPLFRTRSELIASRNAFFIWPNPILVPHTTAANYFATSALSFLTLVFASLVTLQKTPKNLVLLLYATLLVLYSTFTPLPHQLFISQFCENSNLFIAPLFPTPKKPWKYVYYGKNDKKQILANQKGRHQSSDSVQITAPHELRYLPKEVWILPTKQNPSTRVYADLTDVCHAHPSRKSSYPLIGSLSISPPSLLYALHLWKASYFEKRSNPRITHVDVASRPNQPLCRVITASKFFFFGTA